MSDPRSTIPSVDKLLGFAPFEPLVERYGRERVVQALRETVVDVRMAVGKGDGGDLSDPDQYASGAQARLEAADLPSLRPLINATGVVLHTNLGRAPLAGAAVEAMSAAARQYSNLEYDTVGGVRGSRYVHCVSLLTELTGAEDAVVVNNAAGALVLALNTFATGRGVLVSRGELVEIGGGFRIPEILERAGASLVEVGSTNRTRIDDYREALPRHDVAALLKVHRSNFRISGFTEEASLGDLARLGEGSIPLVHDLGSGLMIHSADLGLPEEPTPRESLAAGADIVIFSGDKLLGGPQGGVILGRSDLMGRIRSNPLCRALRVDKVTLAGLEATLRLYRRPEIAVEEIPVLSMLTASAEVLRTKATGVADDLVAQGVSCSICETRGAVGGGTFPGVELSSFGVEIQAAQGANALAAALREASPGVIGRIVDDKLVLDVRTVLPGQEADLARIVGEVVAPNTESE